MVRPANDDYAVPSGTQVRIGAWGQGAAPPPPPPPPPSAGPTLALSGSLTATAGASAQYTVTAANLTGALPNTPQSSLSAAFTPTVVNNAPGELVKLFSAVFNVAGTHQLKTVAAGGIESNTLAVVVSAAPNPPPPPPPPPPGSTVANVVVGPESLLTGQDLAAGTYSWGAAVLPLRGQVPNGSVLRSTDLAGLRSTVTSRWDDDSARVVIVHGTSAHTLNQERTFSLQTSTATDTPLTAAAISAQVTSVSVDFGSGFGTATITDFSAPERVWWANEHSIRGRYRVAAPTPGSTKLEAVLDIEACAGGADIDGVVENCLMTTSAPVVPTSANYTAAAVTVNGTAVLTVDGTAGPGGAHTSLRAWHFRHTVGYVSKRIRARQVHTELQAHPLLFKPARASAVDQTPYGTDAFTPWTTGRQRPTTMGGGGDHPSIGTLPFWQCLALSTGDARAWRATEVSDLAVLGYAVNYRDSGTGLVPTLTQLAGKSMQITTPGANGYWPGLSYYNGAMGWEVAHHPAAGLMSFLSRPSPVFIELAQKVAVTNGTWSTYQGGATGVFGGPYQGRGKAWCMRSLAHAAFITPDALPWKAAAITSLSANVTYMDAYRTDSKALLGAIWGDTPTVVSDSAPARPGFQEPLWFHQYLAVELHKTASARLLTGSAQTAMNTLADWACMQPVRWINEQANGSWRYVPYTYTLGRDGSTINSLPDYAQQSAWAHSDSPPAVSGSWFAFANYKADTYAEYTANTALNAYYPAYLYTALVAAVERNLSGASTAYETMRTNVTGFETWLNGGATEPRFSPTPRGYVPPTFWGSGSSTGTLVGTLFTPARDGAELVNAAAVAALPSNAWIEVAGTRLDGLESQITAAIPGWADKGNSKWDGYTDAWVGMAFDTRPGFERGWYVGGGGHSASTNNGIYRFDARKMKWAIQNLPTDSAAWSPYYIGETSYPVKASRVISGSSWSTSEALQALQDVYGPGAGPYNGCQVTLTNGAGFTEVRVYRGETSAWVNFGGLTPFTATGPLPAGWGVDEIYDHSAPNDPVRSSRKPSPRHWYESPTFASNLGVAGKLIAGCRRLWVYDLATDTWELPRYYADLTNGSFMAYENMHGYYDSVTTKYYHIGNNASQGSAPRNFWRRFSDTTWSDMVPGQNTGVSDGRFINASIDAQIVAHKRIGREVWALRYSLGVDASARPGEMRRLNLDTGSSSSHTVTLGASFAGLTFQTGIQSGFWDMQGICFVPELNKWLCNVHTNEFGWEWALIDASTWVCERATSTLGATVSTRPLEGKVEYMAGLVWHFPSGTQNVRIFKPA